mgnify:CR=1 FL=1|jgi:hypothetical protein|tara:strand:- start:1976 stop:2164 length:189 start_codon:yes stop_codon:yes gene_type:complete
MKLDLNLNKKNNVEKVKISENQTAWLLPKCNNFCKMIAYSYNGDLAWVHPEYQNGQDHKKKK